MRVRIGVFCAQEGSALPERILMGTDTRCKLSVLYYDSFEQLETLCRSARNSLDGALFDSDIARRHIRTLGILQKKPSVHLQPSEGDVLRSLLIAMQNDPKLELSHILIDAGHPGALDALFAVETRPVLLGRHTVSGADLSQWQDKTLGRYQMAWGTGCYDVVLTQRITLLPRMEALGIRAQGVYPSDETVAHAFNALLAQIEMRVISQFLPVFGLVGTSEQAIGEVEKAIGHFSKSGEMVFTRRGDGIEIVTTNSHLFALTNGYTACRMHAFLRERIISPVWIGWGIGTDLSHARINAARALRESYANEGHDSHIVNDEGDLLGPLTGNEALPVFDAPTLRRLEDAAHKTGVGLEHIRKIFALLERLGTDELTGELVAQALGVTRRSAARILVRLAQEGLADARQSAAGTKGRPVKCYKINFEI